MNQRFLFEKNFDRPRGSAFLAEPIVASFDAEDLSEQQEPAPPTFSAEELELAKKCGFEDGYNAGRDAAAAEATALQNHLLERLMPQCEALIAAQTELPQQVFESALSLAGSMVLRLFPHLAEEQAAAQFRDLLTQAFEQAADAEKLQVQCSADDRLLLETLIEKTPIAQHFSGKIVYLIQPEFQTGDIRLDWGSGGVERLSSRLRYKLEQILARSTSTPQEEPHHE